MTATTASGNFNNVTTAPRTTTWTSFNQASEITQGGKTTRFAFDAAHQRAIQDNNDTRTLYVGGHLEKVIRKTVPLGQGDELRYYVMTPLGRTAVRTELIHQNKVETRYLHTDHLGSIVAVTNEAGAVTQRYAYDVWGRQTQLSSSDTVSTKVNRGYTDHEMLADFGLIHMNGRVYDPMLGRFISADPNIDGGEVSAGYNRYSYVQNNPLNTTDPSGFFSLKQALIIIAVVVITIYTAGAVSGALYSVGANGAATGALVGSVTAGTISASTAGLIASVAGGLVGGFVSGFAGSLLNGGSLGDAFKAGAIGALTGVVSAGLANQIGSWAQNGNWEWYQKALAHGTAQGATAELSGGEFRHGFYAGFITSSAASGGITKAAGEQLGGKFGRTASAAIIGGTASTIGGGKFMNGAISGAFIQMYNEDLHPKVTTKPLRVDVVSDKALTGAMYTQFGMEVTETNGEITLQPIARITTPVGLDSEVYAAGMEDEMEHVGDYKAYLNGYYKGHLKLLTSNQSLMAAPNRAVIIQQNFLRNMDKIVTIPSRNFWDSGNADQYHQIRTTNGILNPSYNNPQPIVEDIKFYRKKTYGSEN